MDTTRTTSTLTRFGTGFIALILMVSAGITTLPKQAYAVWGFADIVYDPVNWIENAFTTFFEGESHLKEYILDPLAYAVARTAIQTVMRSVINWANSGFEGSPAFVTDLKKSLSDLSDSVTDTFIEELGLSGFINSPFKDVVARELRRSYRRSTADNSFFESDRYTLDQYSEDGNAFLQGDFSRGGIRAWTQTFMNPQNNPIGAFSAARTELEKRIANAVGERGTELQWSKGILSWCGDAPKPTATEPGKDPAADSTTKPPTSLKPTKTGCGPGEQRRTPGSFIHSRIEKATGSDIDSLVAADEIDEMIGSLLQGLVNKMLGGAGFAGLSQSSSGGGRSAVDQATDSTQGTPGISGGSFAGVVDGQITQLERYRTGWQLVKDAGERAKAQCNTGGTPELSAEVDRVLGQATSEVTRAETLLRELRAIKVKLTNTSGGATQTNLTREGSREYEALQSSGRLPTVTQITSILEQSQDIPNRQPPTLLMRMNTIAESRCN